MMCLLMHFIAWRLFSFDITKRNAFNDRRSIDDRMAIRKTTCEITNFRLSFQIFNLRHYSVVNDLNLSSRYLINCISNTRGRSQTETSTNSIVIPHINAIIHCINMWINTA